MMPISSLKIAQKRRRVPLGVAIAIVSIIFAYNVINVHRFIPGNRPPQDAPIDDIEPKGRGALATTPTAKVAPRDNIHATNDGRGKAHSSAHSNARNESDLANTLPASAGGNRSAAIRFGDSWKSNPSRGIPVGERGRIVISYGVCCSKRAQLAARTPAKHDHSRKPYDVATALSASLWLTQTSAWKSLVGEEVSIFIALAYVKGDEESEENLRTLTLWLDNVDENIIKWPYDVSAFDDPNSACVRAGQMGRYYAHESGWVKENDFVMTTDADIFPINATGIMPVLTAKNPDGDYYRAFLKGWGHSLVGKRSIPLFGMGQTAYDWKRSLTATNAPELKDAIRLVRGYAWGFDQTLATRAVRNGGLCSFPADYGMSDAGHGVSSRENATASEARDAYTCYKPSEGIYEHQCLNSVPRERNCHFVHFTPDATAGMFKQIYNTIVARSGSGGAAPKAADSILGKDEDFEDLTSLRKKLRPGVGYDHEDPCTKSVEGRNCNTGRRPSLPFVSGDLFRCLADVIFDESNDYSPAQGDIGCLHYLKSQAEFQEPYVVFVKTDLIHNDPDHLKERIDDVIPGTYILLTHNSDFGASAEIQGKVEALPKLVWWYGQNVASGSIRTTIPIGLENRHWNRQLPEYYSYSGVTKRPKTSLVTASFRPRTVERKNLLQKLVSASWVDTPGFGYGSIERGTASSAHEAWLRDQAKYRFVFAPPGNGIDCHRTWEMILMGVIPILRSTVIDSVFAGLQAVGAVLIVDDWDEVDQKLLESHWSKWGDRIQRQERWREHADGVMLADHWVETLFNKIRQTSKRRGQKVTVEAEEHNMKEASTQLDVPSGVKVEQKTCMATLVSNSTKDVDRLVRVLTSLDLHMAHDKISPLLVFNEGNLDHELKLRILSSTHRQVYFPEVSFGDFPEGFDPNVELSTWHRPGRSKFGYQQMCRFWAHRIWLHPVLDDHDSYMRFDTDSCFTSKLHKHLPGFPSSDKGYVYGANYLKHDQVKVTAGLFKIAQKYVEENKITVKNPDLYRMMGASQPVMVYNNFEISNITFFRQPRVLNFTRRIAEEEPFGILRTRWGDAPIRTLTLSIFAYESEVLWDAAPDGYKHRYNACVLGKTYNLNQAASGKQEDDCPGNCVLSYKDMVHAGERDAATKCSGLGRGKEQSETHCQDDNEGICLAGITVPCSAYLTGVSSHALEGPCNMPIGIVDQHGFQKRLKNFCRKTCGFCGPTDP